MANGSIDDQKKVSLDQLNYGTGEVIGSGGKIWRLQTSPQLVAGNYVKWPNKAALRKKRYGIWNTYTWKDFYENIKYFSFGLLKLGFKKNDKIAIIGDNDPEWWFCQTGGQAAGGVGFGIFIDSIPSEIEYFVLNSDATIVAAKDQEQCDKLLEIKDKIPNVKKVIYWEPKGMWQCNDPWLIDYREVLELGKRYEKENFNFEEMINQGNVDDIACLAYTSGTTGLPKAAMMSYRNLIAWSYSLLDVYPVHTGEDYFSFLCPAWAVDQIMGFVGSLEQGLVVNFPERPETVIEDAREISSVIEIAGARMWEERYRNLQTRIYDADILKKTSFKLGMKVGYRYSELMRQGKKISFFLKGLRHLADSICLHQMRDRLGYVRARICLVAGSMLSPELYRFFQAIGIPLATYYGITEVGFVSIQKPGMMKLGSAGKVMSGRQIQISADGEVLIKGGNTFLFQGYYKRPEATEKALRDEWYHSGDAAYIDEEGFFFFMDRVSEMMALQDGTKFSPTYIESELRCSRYISDAMVVGHERDVVSALIQIDLKNVGQWAETQHIAYNTFVDLSQKKGVYDLILEEIINVNKRIPENSRIRTFVNLHKEFDADEAEMTRTRKLRRSPLEIKYKEIIDGIYGKKDSVPVRTEVKYRDGRTGSVFADIKIKRLEVKGNGHRVCY